MSDIADDKENSDYGYVAEDEMQVEADNADYSSEEAEIQVDESDRILDKYGFDVSYSPETDSYVLRYKDDVLGTVSRDLSAKDFDYDEWIKSRYEEMKQKFSGPMELQFKNYELYEYVTSDNFKGAFEGGYRDGNKIVTVNYYLKPENRDKLGEFLGQKYNFPAERLNDLIKDMTSVSNYEAISTGEHEINHFFDDKNFGTRLYDLPPQYMAKLGMLTEIKSNMKEVGLALDMYAVTGDEKYFDVLNNITPESLEEIKSAAREAREEGNPVDPQFIAGMVYSGWLEKNNQAGKRYSEQAYAVSTPKNHRYPLFALEDNADAQKRYVERVREMFGDVMGLGDVSQAVNPNFELNEDLQGRLDYDLETELMHEYALIRNENLKKIMTHNAVNAEQYAKNLVEYFQRVQIVDKDGIKRTADENALLEAYLDSILQDNSLAETKDITPAESVNDDTLHRQAPCDGNTYMAMSQRKQKQR